MNFFMNYGFSILLIIIAWGIFAEYPQQETCIFAILVTAVLTYNKLMEE